MRKNLVFIVIAALIIGASVMWDSRNNFTWGKKDSAWYAVYLTNNQVYFGHIASLKDDTLALEDVHYAEAYQEPAQIAKSSKFAITQAPKQTFRVVRRSADSMLASNHTLFINRTSVLYWEKFSPNAEVVKLLEQSM